jgi:hypothetical protein
MRFGWILVLTCSVAFALYLYYRSAVVAMISSHREELLSPAVFAILGFLASEGWQSIRRDRNHRNTSRTIAGPLIEGTIKSGIAYAIVSTCQGRSLTDEEANAVRQSLESSKNEIMPLQDQYHHERPFAYLQFGLWAGAIDDVNRELEAGADKVRLLLLFERVQQELLKLEKLLMRG